MKLMPAILSLALLASCAKSPEPQNAPLQADESTKSIVLLGAIDSQKQHDTDDEQVELWRLRSFVKKESHAVRHDLYLQVTYRSDMKYYKSATGEDGKHLRVRTLYRKGGDCDEDDCERVERLSINVADRDLRKYSSKGYRIKVTAKNGESIVLKLSSGMIRRQLEAADNYRN